jgi:hypothetical protein
VRPSRRYFMDCSSGLTDGHRFTDIDLEARRRFRGEDHGMGDIIGGDGCVEPALVAFDDSGMIRIAIEKRRVPLDAGHIHQNADLAGAVPAPGLRRDADQWR